jgi:hypothetical protein
MKPYADITKFYKGTPGTISGATQIHNLLNEAYYNQLQYDVLACTKISQFHHMQTYICYTLKI